jgi:hypothetical protein
VNNSCSKLRIRLTSRLGNLLLFPSMGRGKPESKYPWRKVVNNNCTKVHDLVAYPPCTEARRCVCVYTLHILVHTPVCVHTPVVLHAVQHGSTTKFSTAVNLVFAGITDIF